RYHVGVDPWLRAGLPTLTNYPETPPKVTTVLTPQPRLHSSETCSPDWLALVGVAFTLVLHLGLQARGPNVLFMVGAGVFWTAFVGFRAVDRKDVFRWWGFRADNVVQASVLPAILFAAFAAVAALYAGMQGTLRFPPHALLLLLLYPAWGVI